ncbi:MAG: LytTR family DNA-binding domain-containing protein [Kofleriaceae bacterium]
MSASIPTSPTAPIAAPITVFVAEDEPLARAGLLAMLASLPQWRVLGAAGDGRAALEACLAAPPDVVLADIRMPILDGLELVRELRAHGLSPQVAFLTAYDTYAVDAFRLAAVDYLLKPLSDADFARCVDRLRDRVLAARAAATLDAHGLSLDALVATQRWARRLVVRSLGRVDVVPLDEVIALHAEGNYVNVVTRDATWLHRETLKSLRERLDPEAFLQVHRSTIVAVREIRRVERGAGGTQLRLADDTLVPVGPTYVAAIERALG